MVSRVLYHPHFVSQIAKQRRKMELFIHIRHGGQRAAPSLRIPSDSFTETQRCQGSHSRSQVGIFIPFFSSSKKSSAEAPRFGKKIKENPISYHLSDKTKTKDMLNKYIKQRESTEVYRNGAEKCQEPEREEKNYVVAHGLGMLAGGGYCERLWCCLCLMWISQSPGGGFGAMGDAPPMGMAGVRRGVRALRMRSK